MKGFVYAIRAGDSSHIKIGYSQSPVRRLATLQSGSPLPLKLVATVKGDRFIEEHVHTAFGGCMTRLSGEWFDCPLSDPALRELFVFVELFLEAKSPEDRAALVEMQAEFAEAGKEAMAA